jgi:phage gpG-like protein
MKNDFIKQIRETRDQVLKSALQFRLEVALDLQAEIQKNVKETFGADKPGRSPITRRAAGRTARTSGRGGGLFGSVQVQADPKWGMVVTVGGAGVPYAGIHEFGGVIRPKRAKYLTIPLNPKFAGMRAREFDLVWGIDEEWGSVLMTRSGEIAYLLRKKATIPARPYIRPAIKTVAKDPRVKASLKNAFKGVEVEIG